MTTWYPGLVYRWNTRLIQPQFLSEHDQCPREPLAATVNRIRVVWSVIWGFIKQCSALQEEEEGGGGGR